MVGLWLKVVCIVASLMGCGVITIRPKPDVWLYHNGHEEYRVKDGKSYTPQGRRVHDGEVMKCWVTGKLIGVGDLSREGRRVYADNE